ncbi:MAG: hypothetical protein HQM16_00780 [Deltaproteobacteria bacterium]|nr:hypothetical protein [Deltaproteobacteria bacterium]
MAETINAMEYIWDRIPKQKDGKTIKYIKGDVDYLYLHGFVDTRNFTLEEWKAAFKPYAQPDGSYVLNKDQFLALRMYRYTGPSDEFFDALRIQEGPWTDKELQYLYDRSIGVASNISSKTFWAYINSLKKHTHYINKDGHFMMDMAVKMGIDSMVKMHPSPRTLLEKEVRRIRIEKDKQKFKSQFARDTSGFSIGQTESENKEDAFKKLQGPSKQTAAPAKEAAAQETIDLKSLLKPRPKMRG